MQDNVALQTARFSLEGWMTLSKGEIAGGDVWLKQGGAINLSNICLAARLWHTCPVNSRSQTGTTVVKILVDENMPYAR
ncbi:hypothetical protein ONQ97_26950, partial [Salmonella enterica subsp. enterica serovar Virginia]|nr:hypothetical protein [Salmonella enterica subsp. enterica serovar Virginia]